MKKQSRFFFTVSALILALGAQSCASSSARKSVDQKMSSQPNNLTRADLREEAANSIQSSKNLDADQKEKLMALLSEAHSRSDELIQESIRLRGVLLQEVMATDYKKAEVDIVKKRLRDVQNQMLSNVFDSIDRANQIMGRQRVENAQILRSLYTFPIERMGARFDD